jgi:FkbM family methyltransferase
MSNIEAEAVPGGTASLPYYAGGRSRAAGVALEPARRNREPTSSTGRRKGLATYTIENLPCSTSLGTIEPGRTHLVLTSRLTALARRYVRFAPGTVGKARIVDQYLNASLRDRPITRDVVLCDGTRVCVDTRDIVQRYLYQFGIWEPSLTSWLTRTLRPGDVFVDVGANIGYYALLAARLVGNRGSVVAIEPSPVAHAALRRNVARNHADNVRLVSYAVAEDHHELAFYEPKPGAHSVTTSVRTRDDQIPAFRTRAHPLSSLLTAEELGAARVIKIDIEGGEYAALAGLVPVLSGACEDMEIVVEVSESLLARQSRTIADATRLLTDRGFHPYRLVNSYRPSSYLSAPAAPRRVREAVTGDADLVFSRVDAEIL